MYIKVRTVKVHLKLYVFPTTEKLHSGAKGHKITKTRVNIGVALFRVLEHQDYSSTGLKSDTELATGPLYWYVKTCNVNMIDAAYVAAITFLSWFHDVSYVC